MANVVSEYIELDVETMKRIKNVPYEMPHKRLEAAVDFVDDIIKQLGSEDRKVFEEVEEC
jgi:hypothetical protein